MSWGFYNALVAAFFSGFVVATLLLGWKIRALRRQIDGLGSSIKITQELNERIAGLKGRLNQSLEAQVSQ